MHTHHTHIQVKLIKKKNYCKKRRAIPTNHRIDSNFVKKKVLFYYFIITIGGAVKNCHLTPPIEAAKFKKKTIESRPLISRSVFSSKDCFFSNFFFLILKSKSHVVRQNPNRIFLFEPRAKIEEDEKLTYYRINNNNNSTKYTEDDDDDDKYVKKNCSLRFLQFSKNLKSRLRLNFAVYRNE